MKVKIGSVATVWRWKWVWGEPAPKGQLGRQSLCIDMGVAGAATPPKKRPLCSSRDELMGDCGGWRVVLGLEGVFWG